VKTFIYTNVDRDGMLNGPDQDEVRQVSQLVGSEAFLYSGGIGTLDDLRVLAGLGLPNLTGVIVGKALYEQRFGISEAQPTLDGTEVSASS
jgi:phosphoribosylformimino-5-aminoimidazole carboxamide ribotide isomerase